MAFLHGVETIQVNTGARPITTVRTGVIGLVGTASKYTLGDQAQWPSPNTPVLVSSYSDAVKYFGTEGKDSYTIPAALKAIYDQGPAICIVVNILDPTTHNANITNEVVAFSASTDTLQLLHAGVNTVVVKDSTAVTTYTVGTDYTVDAVTGIITRVRTGTITSAQSMKVSYAYMNPASVVASDIVGTITSGNRTGAQCWLDAANLLGIKPRVLIAPGYASSATTLTGLDTLASALRAVWIGDVASGTTLTNALLTRAAGAIFNTASMRGIGCYPYLKDSGGTLRPMSGYLAGVIAASDNDPSRGYWYSPSNVEFKGVTALERALSFQVNDPTCDVNTLDANGFVTAATGYAMGVRAWGNRNLSYPTSTLPQNFIPVLRVQDVLWDSVEYATLQFIDQPINQALVDTIRASVNAFIRTLVGRGALVDGECTFDKTKNPNVELAAGHLTFDITFLPPYPAERITFNSFIDINLYRGLK